MKRLFILSCALCVALFAGCGDDNDGNPAGPTGSARKIVGKWKQVDEEGGGGNLDLSFVIEFRADGILVGNVHFSGIFFGSAVRYSIDGDRIILSEKGVLFSETDEGWEIEVEEIDEDEGSMSGARFGFDGDFLNLVYPDTSIQKYQSTRDPVIGPDEVLKAVKDLP